MSGAPVDGNVYAWELMHNYDAALLTALRDQNPGTEHKLLVARASVLSALGAEPPQEVVKTEERVDFKELSSIAAVAGTLRRDGEIGMAETLERAVNSLQSIAPEERVKVGGKIIGLDELERRINTAQDTVIALCKPRGSDGSREWLMSIPAREDHDPDLVIDAALGGALKLVQMVREAQALRDELARMYPERVAALDEARDHLHKIHRQVTGLASPQPVYVSETDTRIGPPERAPQAEVFAEAQRIAQQRKAEIDALHTLGESAE